MSKSTKDIVSREMEEVDFELGDKVYVSGDKKKWGKVKYIGYPHFSTGLWVGLEVLDINLGRNDGSIKGRRYFAAKPNHGLFVRADCCSKFINTLEEGDEQDSTKSSMNVLTRNLLNKSASVRSTASNIAKAHFLKPSSYMRPLAPQEMGSSSKPDAKPSTEAVQATSSADLMLERIQSVLNQANKSKYGSDFSASLSSSAASTASTPSKLISPILREHMTFDGSTHGYYNSRQQSGQSSPIPSGASSAISSSSAKSISNSTITSIPNVTLASRSTEQEDPGGTFTVGSQRAQKVGSNSQSLETIIAQLVSSDEFLQIMKKKLANGDNKEKSSFQSNTTANMTTNSIQVNSDLEKDVEMLKRRVNEMGEIMASMLTTVEVAQKSLDMLVVNKGNNLSSNLPPPIQSDALLSSTAPPPSSSNSFGDFGRDQEIFKLKHALGIVSQLAKQAVDTNALERRKHAEEISKYEELLKQKS